MACVRTYLKKDGVADNSERGVWSLTARGLTLPQPEIISIPQRVRAADYEQRRKREIEEIKESVEALVSIAEAEEDETLRSWKEQLLDALLAMKPDAFERLCQRILRESGFTKVEVTGKSGDGGIDGIGIIDLVDGDNLADLLKQLRLGVQVRMVEEIEVEPNFFVAI
jgi:restriction system protein